MAKMHTRRRGISGSKKPLTAAAPVWVTHKPEEIEALILKLAKQGLSPSQIGLVLRDSYGVPDVEKLTGKKLCKILEEKGHSQEIPESLANLIKTAKKIKKHLETNKKDMVSKHELHLTESKIFRLAKYYKRNGKLPESWKYA